MLRLLLLITVVVILVVVEEEEEEEEKCAYLYLIHSQATLQVKLLDTLVLVHAASR